MNSGSLSMYNIWIFSEFFYVWLSYLCKSLRIVCLVWPTRLVVLAMGEVLSFGFDLAVSLPSDRRGCKARIALLPSRITRWGFYHIAWIYPSTSCVTPRIRCARCHSVIRRRCHVICLRVAFYHVIMCIALHTCSFLAFEHFPRCPFCNPALLCPPAFPVSSLVVSGC